MDGKKKKKLSHKFQGCLSFEGRIYMTIPEVVRFCRAFKYFKGSDLADLLEKANIRKHDSLLEVARKKKGLFGGFFGTETEEGRTET